MGKGNFGVITLEAADGSSVDMVQLGEYRLYGRDYTILSPVDDDDEFNVYEITADSRGNEHYDRVYDEKIIDKVMDLFLAEDEEEKRAKRNSGSSGQKGGSSKKGLKYMIPAIGIVVFFLVAVLADVDWLLLGSLACIVVLIVFAVKDIKAWFDKKKK